MGLLTDKVRSLHAAPVALPETLAHLRLRVLRALLTALVVLGSFEVVTHPEAAPSVLLPNAIAITLVGALAVASFLRPKWSHRITTLLVLTILGLEHATGSAWIGTGFQPGIVLYPVIVILTAFLGRGWLLLLTVVFLGFQLLRYPHPADPTLAVVWTNTLMGYVASSLLSGLFWYGVSQLEAAHLKKRAELSAALKARTSLLRLLFHDIANPLTALSAHVELAEIEGGQLPVAEALPSLELLWSVMESARALVIAERQQFFDQLSVLSVDRSVRHALGPHRAAGKRKGLKFQLELAPDLTVRAHPELLTTTILGNLFSNAVKFCRPEGTVLATSQLKEGRVVIGIENEGDPLTDETRRQILSGTSTSSTPGTHGEPGHGFGLRLVRDFSVMMGGELLVENVEGGVRLSVSLPSDPGGSPRGGS